ncbi:hypothetical protein GCM10023331_30680 [Algivirga pacifica]|uniref:Uncharacterized protein n=2 Tax=Algivirga pacifica TaxID=1162670 RepID=A0ABP9DHG7_9BACT
MDYQTEVEVPSLIGIEFPLKVLTPKIETNSESTFALNDTRKDMVEQVLLKELTLSVTTPSGGDFSFLESMTVFLTAEGLEEIEVASIKNIPWQVGNTLTLTPTGADLQEYIKKDEFQLRLNTVTDELITQDYTINIDATFFIDAKVLGL